MARAALAAMLAACAAAATADDLRNWFDDPFFRVSSAIADCPQPAGPFVGRQQMLAQSHRRAEKGTTAWLAGEAARPKAYAYDAEIAAGVAQAFRDDRRFDRTSLWVTVQGRVVYVEGCAPAGTDLAALEAMVAAVPEVQRATAIVRLGPRARAPYRRRY